MLQRDAERRADRVTARYQRIDPTLIAGCGATVRRDRRPERVTTIRAWTYVAASAAGKATVRGGAPQQRPVVRRRTELTLPPLPRVSPAAASAALRRSARASRRSRAPSRRANAAARP